MKTILVTFTLLLTLNFAFAQDANDPKAFRTGTFVYKGIEDKAKVIRTKKTQTEVFNDGKSKLIMKIKWVDKTSYVLTLKKAINAPGCLKIGDTITATLVKQEGKTFYCKSKSENCGKADVVMIKVEE